MIRWSTFDERVAQLWSNQDRWRRNHRLLAEETARVMRQVADTRRYIARVYDDRAARASAANAAHLRARARQFDEIANRAARLAEKEEEAARD